MEEQNSHDRNNPLLAINPTTNTILLLMGGRVLPFHDLGRVQQFLDKLTDELEALKGLIHRNCSEAIQDEDGKRAVASWEEALHRGKNTHVRSNSIEKEGGVTRKVRGEGNVPKRIMDSKSEGDSENKLMKSEKYGAEPGRYSTYSGSVNTSKALKTEL